MQSSSRPSHQAASATRSRRSASATPSNGPAALAASKHACQSWRVHASRASSSRGAAMTPMVADRRSGAHPPVVALRGSGMVEMTHPPSPRWWCSRPMRARPPSGNHGRVRTHDTVARLIQHGRDREAAELGSEQLARTTGDVPMDAISQLDVVFPLLDGLVTSLDDDQLDRPTPCANFTVRQVLEHMIGGGTMFAAAFRGETAPAADMPSDVIGAFPKAMANLHDAA